MRSSACNARKICYIAPVTKNEIGKTNVVCEGFIISETHDAHIFLSELLFKISTSWTNDKVYAIVYDESTT